jgi:signal transduction histidine kinase
LRVEISDDGKVGLAAESAAVTSADATGESAAPKNAEGHGIIGMRERILALGGSFEADVCTDEEGKASGFTVKAEVPL